MSSNKRFICIVMCLIISALSLCSCTNESSIFIENDESSIYSGDSYNDLEVLFDIEIIEITDEEETSTTEETTTTEEETTTSYSIPDRALPTPQETSTTRETTITEKTTTKTTTKKTTTTTKTITTTTAIETSAATTKSTDIGITQAEFYMLANLVAHEYGADWVATAEKAKVVMTVMNRVRSSRFPNTIREVILQKNQYCWVPDSYYWKRTTQGCKDAVTYYFTHQSEFSTNLYSFYGNGRENIFY